MNVSEWMHEQFTEERLLRWMDGHNPKRRYGCYSFVQVLDGGYFVDDKTRRSRYDAVPNIWSVVNCGKHDRRSRYYLRVTFRHAAGSPSDVVAEVRMWSSGVWGAVPSRSVTGELVFSARDNAPKKLNREVRRLRDVLLAA